MAATTFKQFFTVVRTLLYIQQLDCYYSRALLYCQKLKLLVYFLAVFTDVTTSVVSSSFQDYLVYHYCGLSLQDLYGVF